jgi:hypothetical protein
MRAFEEIERDVRGLIPVALWGQYGHLSYLEMSYMTELEPWEGILRQAHYDYRSAEDQ